MTLRLALEITADASGLKAEVVGAERAVDAFGVSAEQAAAKVRDMESASRAAAAAARDAATAAATGAPFGSINARRLVDQRLGVRTDFDTSEREADILAFGRALDELRARYVPLFEIERRRQAILEGIADAQRKGAITATEAAAAADRVAQAMDGEAAAARASSAAIAERSEEMRRAEQRALPNSAFQINQRVGVRTDFDTSEREADILAFGQAREDLRARWNPAFAVQRVYLANLREIREAHRTGVLSADEMAAAITREKNAYAALVREESRQAAGGLPAWRRGMVFSQVLDVGASLASGMNPALILAQQGPQFIESYGGVKETIEGVTKAITPVRGLIGGVTGAVVTGALAWNSYLNAVKEVETAAAGLGRGSGASTGALDLIATNAAAAGGISDREGGSIEAALLRTGRIGAEAFQPIIAMSKDFAATIGTDLAGAGEQLAAIFADPARGAERLHEQYRLISGAQARYVQQLARQGEADRARLVLVDALNGRLVDAETATTALGRAWDAVANSASNAWQAIGRAIDRRVSGETPEREIDRLKRERDGAGGFDPTLDYDLFGARDRRIKELEDRVEAERRTAEAERRKRLDESAGSLAVGIAERSPVTEIDRRRRELEEDIRNLEAGQGKAGLTAEENDRIARSIEAKRAALEGLRPAYERQIELDQLDAQIQQARDPIARAELAARRERVALAAEEIGPAERAARIETARTQALNESLGATRSAVAGMREETAARAAVNDAIASGAAPLSALETLVRREVELRPLLVAHARAEGQTKRELAAIIENLRNAYAAEAEERGRSQALGAIGAQRDDIERLTAELDLVTAGTGERARAVAALEAEQRIRALGVDARGREAEQLRANARAIADVTVELERQRDAWESIQGVGTRSIDAISDALADGKGSVGDVLSAIGTDLRREGMRLGFANPLKNAIFGTNEGTLSDASGLIGRLLGGAANDNPAAAAAKAAATASASLMTVTASTVVVNGAVAGGVGSNMLAAAGAPTPSDRVAGAFAAFAPSGVPSFAAPGAFQGAFAASDAATGYPGFAARVARLESGFNPQAYNRSGAAGLFQFMPGTARDYGLQNPYDPATATRAFTQLTLDNRAYLAGRLARQPTAGELYLAHQQGRQGAFDLLSNPSAPATSVVGTAAVVQNGGRADMTAAEFSSMWTTKLDGAGASVQAFAATTDAAKSSVEGLGSGAQSVAKTVTDAATGVGGSAKALETAAGQVPAQAEGFFQSLFGALGKGVDTVGSAVGGAGSGIGGFLSTIASSIFKPAAAAAPAVAAATHHGGDIVGQGRSDGRLWDPALWSGAARAHAGLRPGERPIIALDEEGVFTPKQMDNADRILAAALAPRTLRLVVDNAAPTAAAAVAGPAVRTPRPAAGASSGWNDEPGPRTAGVGDEHYHITVQTPDPRSFREGRASVVRGASRIAAQARRHE
jgi:hypothetical protein